MIALGEWLAITSLVMQVVAAVHGVIKIFEKAQNAPKELEELRRSLLRLSDNCDQIRAQGETTESFPLQQYDIDEIRNTLEQCKKLLEDYRDAQSENGVLRAVWGTQNHDEVVRYQTLIDRHFVQILLPFWMKTLCRTPWGSSEEDRAVVPSVGNLPVRKKSCVPREQVDKLAEGLKQLNNDESPSESKKTLQKLDKVLQQCWQSLGLPVDNANTIPLPAVIPPSDLSFTIAPTILTLENAPKKHKHIRLNKVHIMARDNKCRILLYQNKDASVRVTQIIPFGCIPWTPKKENTRVSFLKPCVVTIIDEDGHHIYHIDPKYRFASLGPCQRFQETLREREHLGAFDFVKLSDNEDLLSRRQVLRFWKRTKGYGVPVVTMTFLQSSIGDGCRHKEYDLAIFNCTAVLTSSSRNPLKRRHHTDIVQLLSTKIHPATSVHIQFETVPEAIDFKRFFESSRSPPPELNFVLPSPTVGWLSSEPTPSDSTWQENMPPKLEDLDIGQGWDLPWGPESSESRASTAVDY